MSLFFQKCYFSLNLWEHIFSSSSSKFFWKLKIASGGNHFEREARRTFVLIMTPPFLPPSWHLLCKDSSEETFQSWKWKQKRKLNNVFLSLFSVYHVCFLGSIDSQKSRQSLTSSWGWDQVWNPPDPTGKFDVCPTTLSGLKHDAEMATSWNIQLWIFDVFEHHWRTNLQWFESVSDFPLGFDQLWRRGNWLGIS